MGAYLTQNTSWTNVERALEGLRGAQLLSIDGIRRTPLARLERLIRSAGYFRQKAQRLKGFVEHLDRQHLGSLERMLALPTAVLRQELRMLNGVGPETADSILLYAGNHPVFVVDAYTRRILERHWLIDQGWGYEEIRELVERALAKADLAGIQSDLSSGAHGPRGSSHSPSRMSTGARAPRAQVLNEMHALIVGVGKNYCKKSQPECEQCPLKVFLPAAE